jgi:hypothetical protein
MVGVAASAALLTAGLGVGAVVPAALAVTASCGVVVDVAPDVGASYVDFADVTGVPGTNEAYAVGSTGAADSAPYVQYYDGATWTPVPVDPPAGAVSSWLAAVSADDTGDVWAVGGFTQTEGFEDESGWVLHWDGVSWTSDLLASPDAAAIWWSGVDIAAVSSSDVWVVGDWSNNDIARPMYQHWNGSSWDLQDPDTAFTFEEADGVSVSPNGEAFSVGHAQEGGVLRHWNGTDSLWEAVGGPVAGAQYYSVAAVGDADVWAVGIAGGHNSARHWDGTNFTAAPVPAVSTFDKLQGVYAGPGGELWAAGEADFDEAPFRVPTLARYDGAAWRFQPTPTTGVDVAERFGVGGGGDGIYLAGREESHGAVTRHCGSTVSALVGLGNDISTNDGDGTATSEDPVETRVTLPSAVSGVVSVRQTYTSPLAVGVDAPEATSADPLEMRFVVDGTRYVGTSRGTRVLKDGVAVAACTLSDGTATPDPCVASATTSGDRLVSVLTSTGGTFTVSQAPVTATVTPPATLAGAVAVAFPEAVQNVTGDNIVLRSGSKVLPATLTCRNGGGFVQDCATGGTIRTVAVQPAATLVPGEDYTLTVNPASALDPVTDSNGVPVTTTTKAFEGAKSHQENSSAIAYAWRNVSKSAAYGGSYRVAHLSGETARYSFTGTGVTWYTTTGPKQGKAVVRIDGTAKCTCDLYAAANHFKVARSFSGLSAGTHTLSITVTGTKNKKSSGRAVASDAIKSAGGSVVANPPAVFGWQRFSSSKASGGKAAREDYAGTTATFVFSGTKVTWRALRSPSSGKAKVTIDGVSKGTIDLYASATGAKTYTFGSLSNGRHTLRIRVLGTKRAASNGRLVSIDRLDVT